VTLNIYTMETPTLVILIWVAFRVSVVERRLKLIEKAINLPVKADEESTELAELNEAVKLSTLKTDSLT
jgi:hypothetical protein